jgi:Zn-dependent protease with chaperone function
MTPSRHLQRGASPRATLIALAVVCVLVYAVIWAFTGGLRLGTSLAARAVPVSWEEKWGELVTESLAPPSSRCSAPVPEVQRIVDRLAREVHGRDYRWNVAVIQNPEVNAFAAPGGYIVVHSALLERTKTPEQLAGVLAHEMQHVLQRHATAGLIRSLFFRLALAYLIGDMGGALAVDAASTLGNLQFQRGDEERADLAGYELLRAARVDPEGMLQVFQMFEREAGAQPGVLRYISSHPLPADRVAALRNLGRPSTSEPLLPGVNWAAVAHSCRVSP